MDVLVNVLIAEALLHGTKDARDIAMTTRSSWLEKSVLAYARGRGQRIAQACGAELKLFIEKHPRGTVGAARAIRTASDDLLVVNVDNLTSLDLTAFLEHHPFHPGSPDDRYTYRAVPSTIRPSVN